MRGWLGGQGEYPRMREIVVDTETTGLDPGSGHRIVEIGCVELNHHIRTGESFHAYANPERAMPDAAFRVHGLSDAFLSDKPKFEAVAGDFLAFIGDAPLVIHNAAFDLGFLNAELQRIDRPSLDSGRAIDTVGLARRRFPGARVSLDDLCRRFEIDLSGRTKHGALLDAELLAEVYLELCGGRQPDLALASAADSGSGVMVERPVRPARPHAPTASELAAHELLLDQIEKPVWRR